MEDFKIKKRNVELRSEKVRTIIGQIPPVLIRYGTVSIILVLLCIMLTLYHLPYKRIYSGTATFFNLPTSLQSDIIDLPILLRFNEHPDESFKGQNISIISHESEFTGEIIDYSFIRDTLNRQKAVCRFNFKDIKALEAQTVDMRIVISHGNLLNKIFSHKLMYNAQ